jgi:hypothetical protein
VALVTADGGRTPKGQKVLTKGLDGESPWLFKSLLETFER